MEKTNTTTTDIIIFNSRDQLLRIDSGQIAYCEADGNLTHIVATGGLKVTVGMSLAQMELQLARSSAQGRRRFLRVGKRFIVNMDFIFQVNMQRQLLVLADYAGMHVGLPVSKDALKRVKELVVESKR